MAIATTSPDLSIHRSTNAWDVDLWKLQQQLFSHCRYLGHAQARGTAPITLLPDKAGGSYHYIFLRESVALAKVVGKTTVVARVKDVASETAVPTSSAPCDDL